MSTIIFGSTIDLLSAGTPSSGGYIVAYDLDGILKQKDEFGVITEIGGGPTGGIGATPSFYDVLSVNNDTVTYDIIMGTSTSILSSNGGGQIDLANEVSITTDNGSFNQGYVYVTGTQGKFGYNDSFIDTYDTFLGLYVNNIQQIKIGNNSTASVSSTGVDKYGTIISSNLSTIDAGVVNSVIIGGAGISATQSNFVYIGGSLNINNSYTFPNTDGTSGQGLVTDGNGNIYWSSSTSDWKDVLSVGNYSDIYSIIMGTSTNISTINGGGQIELDVAGSPNSVAISTDNGSLVTSNLQLDPDLVILDTSGNLNIGAGTASILTDNAQGLVYGFDYSSTFVGNSLVNKIYVDTGTTSLWSNFNNYLPLSGGTLTGNLTVDGDLTVSGTQTVINTENLYVEDNIITLNATYSGPATVDSGIEVNLGDGTYSKVLWDAGTGYWQVGLSGSESTIITEAGSGLLKSNNELSVDFGTVSSISYVDAGTASLWAAIESNNEWSEILSNGNESLGNNAIMSSQDILEFEAVGITYSITGLANNFPLTGFQYSITGDLTSEIFVGNVIKIENTPNNVNDGKHVITGATFTGGNTYFQWSGIVTEFNTPYGDATTNIQLAEFYDNGDEFVLNIPFASGGLIYKDDYSSTFVTHSLVDKLYVDSGTASIWSAIDSINNDYITEVIGGQGLTGGGTAGTVTLDVQVDNGLSIESDIIILGGTLSQNTTINGSQLDLVLGNIGTILMTASTFDVEADGFVSIDAGTGSAQFLADDNITLSSNSIDLASTGDINFTFNNGNLTDGSGNGYGLVYTSDYSGTFVTNSLVSKSYVDSIINSNNELSEVLANGNESGPNDIIMSNDQVIKSLTGSSTLDLRYSSTNNTIFLGNDPSSWKEVLYLSPAYIELSSYGSASSQIQFWTDNNSLRIDESINELFWSGADNSLKINSTVFSVGIGGFSGFVQLSTAGTVLGRTSFITANNTSSTLETSAQDQYGSIVSSRNSTVNSGVTNTVVLGGKDIAGKTDRTAYVNQIGFTRSAFDGLPSAYEAIVTGPLFGFTADRQIFIPDSSGTFSLTSDLNNYLPLSGGTITGNLIVSGDLTVSGTQTVINTENLYVEDNIITLNATFSGTPILDSGIEVNRGTGTWSKLYWDESQDYWVAGLSGSESVIITENGTGLTKTNNELSVDFGTVSSISYVSDNYLPLTGGTVSGGLQVDSVLSATSIGAGTTTVASGYVLDARGNVVMGKSGVNTLLSFLGPEVDLYGASANYVNIRTGYRIRLYTYSTLIAQFDTAQSIFYGNVTCTGTASTNRLRMTNGASNGYILQSNALGDATWVDPSTIIPTTKYTEFGLSLTAHTTSTITHNLGTQSIICQAWDTSTGETVNVTFKNRATNSVDILSTANVTVDVIIQS